jgi:hypothetical protein
MSRLLVTKSCGIPRPSYIKHSIHSSFSAIVHLSSKDIRERSFNKTTDRASLPSADELPETILERHYFVDDSASHCADPIAIEKPDCLFGKATAIRFL